MDLFCCDTCGCVDALPLAYPGGSPKTTTPAASLQCTKCLTGKWHEHFEQEKYRPDFDVVINRPSGVGLG